ncbi:mitochondrial ATP synthase g subunit-domain-containing protein [Phyllosticta capitalensis]
MSFAASRAVLRHSRFAVRRAPFRNASTTSEAANAAKDKASQASSKATEASGAALSKATEYGSALLQRLSAMGGRTAKVVGFVQSLVPPTVYYSKVVLELGKIVFETRKMSPPSADVFQKYYQSLLSSLKNPSSGAVKPSNILGRLRNMSTAEYTSAGIVAAEVVGFFTVGEMIGRMKLVGYRSSAQAHP